MAMDVSKIEVTGKARYIEVEDAVRNYPVDKEAFGQAIDAANEASNAGLDTQTQLEHAISTYLAVVDFREAGGE